MEKRNVILVTDGDPVARKAVEAATANIGGRCISASAGNPTPLTGDQIIRLIMVAGNDPVVVMVDDKGGGGVGRGELAMLAILKDPSVNVLGVIAVSSNGRDCDGINVTCSITKDGKVIEGAVDKFGNYTGQKDICGDTLSILKDMNDIIVVGIGDPGKMDFQDDITRGAPITTKAFEEVLKRSGYRNSTLGNP